MKLSDRRSTRRKKVPANGYNNNGIHGLSNFTVEAGKMIAATVARGATLVAATQAQGYSRAVAYKWYKVGADRPEGDPLRTFHDDINRALGASISDAEIRVHESSPDKWLSRNPHTKGDWSDRIESTGANGGPVVVFDADQVEDGPEPDPLADAIRERLEADRG